jgi:hypothetical protein
LLRWDVPQSEPQKENILAETWRGFQWGYHAGSAATGFRPLRWQLQCYIGLLHVVGNGTRNGSLTCIIINLKTEVPDGVTIYIDASETKHRRRYSTRRHCTNLSVKFPDISLIKGTTTWS